MLGFSIYVGRMLTADDYNYLIAMRNAGFDTVFTSLQINENDPEQTKSHLKELTKWCSNLDLSIIADVSAVGLEKIGVDIHDVGQVQALDLTGLRIDAGIGMDVVAKLSKSMPIALNASTITEKDLLDLKEYNAAFDHLVAWHNYYPRPETGLGAEWLDKKNKWLKEHDLQTLAFIPGDGELRGPIFAGLPTLECQRHENPLAAMIELKKLHVDHVFVGDVSLKQSTINSFINYLKQDAITLHIDRDLPELTENTWHNRPDLAEQVVRLQEGRERQLFNTGLQETKPRPKGSITCDNDKCLHYKGELQITKIDLPADERVNVIGHVVSNDLDLLKVIGAGTKIIFKKVTCNE